MLMANLARDHAADGRPAAPRRHRVRGWLVNAPCAPRPREKAPLSGDAAPRKAHT
jgi:hypothetical protein